LPVPCTCTSPCPHTPFSSWCLWLVANLASLCFFSTFGAALPSSLVGNLLRVCLHVIECPLSDSDSS
jgi:hypothetical protein